MNRNKTFTIDVDHWISILKMKPTEGWSSFAPECEEIRQTLKRATREDLISIQNQVLSHDWRPEDVGAFEKWRALLLGSLIDNDRGNVGAEVCDFATSLYAEFEIPATEWRDFFENQAIPLMREYIAALIANQTKQELESIESRLSKGFYKEYERLKGDPTWGQNIKSKQEW